MRCLWRILNYYMFLKLATLNVVTGTALQYPIPVVTNKVKSVDVSCDSASFNVTVLFEQPFRGLFFAKDFSQECRSLGNFSDMISLTLPTNGCGLRLSSYIDKSGLIHMKYSLTLVIQQDRQLRQIADQERSVTCEVENSEFLVKSKLMADVIRTNLLGDKKNERNGRMQHDGWSKDPPTDTTELTKKYQDLLQSARAWMEIIPDGKMDNSLTKLKVGEPAKLIVKSTLPVGIGWKVVECNAHDGLGDTSQKLIDERGCPVDDVLMPMPEVGPVRSIAMMKHQEAVSKFIAFKFPDRDRLHVSCGLQLCRDDCLQEDCSTNITLVNRQGRASTRGNSGEILDQLEVFNSVEVFAPTIDDIRKNNKREQTTASSTYPFLNLPGDRTFCVSPDKMAVAFCILGIIFLGAVIVATCALLKARRVRNNLPYYTRSLFSSSSGLGSAYGSKLLLRESSSVAHSSSKGLQYGRMF